MSTLTAQEGAELIGYFDEWRGPREVFSLPELQVFVQAVRSEREPTWKCTVANVLAALERDDALAPVEIPSEGEYRSFHRYVTPGATAFDVATKLRPRGYLSHATAVFAHGLTEQVPQTIYVNNEQSIKPAPSGRLTQAGLDRAFRSRQRVSKFSFVYGRNRIVILSGKQTGSLGVKPLRIGTTEYPVTDLERTLIDIAVRPAYGGGVYEINAAYAAAVGRVDVKQMVRYLDKLDYAYPYHQAIGFYLERAGVSQANLRPLRDRGLDFDFHLIHGMKDPVLDSSWRIFVPKGL